MVITSIATEGRFDEGRGMEYATAYKLEYWRSSLHGWATYRNDRGSEVGLLLRTDRKRTATRSFVLAYESVETAADKF